jgi:4,5-DOPA dioxygenase extradiol
VPLQLIYPDAGVPVAQLSLQHHLGPAHALAVGRALAALAAEDVLVLGAGNLTHNLGALVGESQSGAGAETAEWAVAFDRWVGDALAEGRWQELVDYRELAPFAEMAHPRDEHLLPLFVAAGAAGGQARGRRINDEFLYGSFSQAAFVFEPQ